MSKGSPKQQQAKHAGEPAVSFPPSALPGTIPRSVASKVTSTTWISLCSMVIALCALLFSIDQAREQRKFQKLSVRPRMTASLFYNDEGAGFLFGGTGIGYATLKTFEVLVDGKSQTDWAEMCHALGFATRPTMEYTVPRPDTVFKPDSYQKVFWIPAGAQAEELKLKAGRIRIRACYCSLYDECWMLDTHREIVESTPSCPKQDIAFTAPPRPVTLP